MNKKLLFQHFDRIAEAPDAIPRLRRFILDLAVRGKLVPTEAELARQRAKVAHASSVNPNTQDACATLNHASSVKNVAYASSVTSPPVNTQDAWSTLNPASSAKQRSSRFQRENANTQDTCATFEPASELLKRIEAEKTRLVTEGKIRKSKPLPPIDAEELPFPTPSGWKWVRLGMALNLINGRAFKPSEWSQSGLPIIRIQNLNNPDAPFNFCDAEIPDRFRVRSGDFLISWSGTPGTSFGAHIWNRGTALLNQHIFRAEFPEAAFQRSFLKLAINSRLLELIEQAQGGVGLQHVTKPTLERLPLTLPPLAEQHRIVAKVDELMALCDDLESAKQEREARRDRFVAATHYRLNNPEAATPDRSPPGDFRPHAQFFLRKDTFERLTTRPQDIKQLRQTILNLAVRGKLVHQDPNDEPASELLKRIQAEKARLVNEGKIRKPKPLSPITPEEIPFEIPKGWEWVRLGELLTEGPQNGLSPKPTTDGSQPKAMTLAATTTGIFNPTCYKHVDCQLRDDSPFWLNPT